VIEVPPLVLIDIATDQGVTGRSDIFAYARLTLKPLVLPIEEIGRDFTGNAIAPFNLMAAMDAKFRLLGWQGLVGMAVSPTAGPLQKKIAKTTPCKVRMLGSQHTSQ